MHNLAMTLALLAVLLQNLVFWQALLPEAMHQNKVCIEVMHVVEHVQKQHPLDHASLNNHTLNQLQANQLQHDLMQSAMDCHFCHLFHHMTPWSEPDLTLVEISLILKWGFAAAIAYILFYLRRLFLAPQGRAPPLKVVLI